jgi:hypothetical protein
MRIARDAADGSLVHAIHEFSVERLFRILLNRPGGGCVCATTIEKNAQNVRKRD